MNKKSEAITSLLVSGRGFEPLFRQRECRYLTD